jgi:hypothetical protein
VNHSHGNEGREEGLLGIRTFVIHPDVVGETIGFLQSVGHHGYEGFVLWSGKLETPDTFRFSTVLIPEQRAMITASGLLVTVEGQALFKMNKTAYERGEILGGQVHTHPTSAYHSSTDDHYPLVTLLGALSVVVPDFARNAPTDMATWAWYRLADCGLWEMVGENTEVVIE